MTSELPEPALAQLRLLGACMDCYGFDALDFMLLCERLHTYYKLRGKEMSQTFKTLLREAVSVGSVFVLLSAAARERKIPPRQTKPSPQMTRISEK